MSRIGWYQVPKQFTMSGAEASNCYKGFNSNDPNFWALTYADNTHTPRGTDGRLDCYIMRGARKVVMAKYAWNNSNTEGGYIEQIVLRVMRSWHGDDYSKKPRLEYIQEIEKILLKFTNKYYLAPNTQTAIKKRVYGELLNFYY